MNYYVNLHVEFLDVVKNAAATLSADREADAYINTFIRKTRGSHVLSWNKIRTLILRPTKHKKAD